MVPYFSIVLLIKLSISLFEATLQVTVNESNPWDFNSAAAFVHKSPLISVITTFAPSCASAKAIPIQYPDLHR